MARLVPKILLVVAAVLLATAVVAVFYLRMPPPTSSDTRYAMAEGRQIAYRVLGSGRPVLVMTAGLGDGMATFQYVAAELARHGTVILYDRAGYGASGSADTPRDAIAASRELQAVLAQSGVKGPYVLLGHSTGGLYAEYFAAIHPNEIAGLILEDARSADFSRRCWATPNAGMCAPPVALVLLLQAGALPEFKSFERTYDEVRESVPLHGRPVLVLSRFKPARDPSILDALWAKEQDGLTRRYPGAAHVTAPAGGHRVHVDAPDWFVRTILSFLTKTR